MLKHEMTLTEVLIKGIFTTLQKSLKKKMHYEYYSYFRVHEVDSY